MADSPRYQVQQESGGRWVIANAHDEELKWTGEHWSESHPLMFGRQDEAQQYARELFGGKAQAVAQGELFPKDAGTTLSETNKVEAA